MVYDIQSCTVSSCTREAFILAWNPVVGTFEAMNSGQMLAVNGRFGVVDIDSDAFWKSLLPAMHPFRQRPAQHAAS